MIPDGTPVLVRPLRIAGRRLRIASTFHGALAGAAIGACMAPLLAVVSRVASWSFPWIVASAVAGLIGAAAGAWRFSRRIPDTDVCAWVDRRQGGGMAWQAAWEASTRPSEAPWAPLVASCAAIDRIPRPRWRVPHVLRSVPVALLASALAASFPSGTPGPTPGSGTDGAVPGSGARGAAPRPTARGAGAHGVAPVPAEPVATSSVGAPATDGGDPRTTRLLSRLAALEAARRNEVGRGSVGDQAAADGRGSARTDGGPDRGGGPSRDPMSAAAPRSGSGAFVRQARSAAAAATGLAPSARGIVRSYFDEWTVQEEGER